MPSRARAAAAGAAAAIAWGAQERFDRRVFGCDYSDVDLMGFGSRRRGYVVHALNGAAFGIAYHELRKRRDVDAVAMALVENTLLWPLMAFVDRDLLTSPAAFAQATWRHTLFGVLLRRWA